MDVAWECVWIITFLQGRLPMDPQIQALSHPKWPPRESDERAAERRENKGGRNWGWVKDSKQDGGSGRRKMIFDKRQTENKITRKAKMKAVWDWLNRQNQHRALYLCSYWWKAFRSFLTGKHLKTNPGREQEGETENISETMFPLAKSNDKRIFCCLSLHINTLQIVFSLIPTLGCVTLCLNNRLVIMSE